MKRFLLAAIFAAFFVSNAQAKINFMPLNVQISCTDNIAGLLKYVINEGQREVWRKPDAGGGIITVFQNIKTGEWTQIRVLNELACVIATSPKYEAGT